MSRFEVIGKSIVRPDARAKVEGTALYCEDIQGISGLLHARTIKSPIAAGRIVSLDIDKARAVPGIHEIVLARDIPGKNFVPMMLEDWIVAAYDEVRYVGEPLGVIVGDNESSLEEALGAVRITCDPFTPILSPREAMKPGARKINPLGNIFNHHTIRCGDTEKAFTNVDIVIEGTFETGYQEHAYLEPQAALAIPEPAGGMTVMASMQCPFYVQSAVATVLGIPLAMVRVIQTTTGGAFGGKEDIPSRYAALAALAAWKSRRPVRLILSREEDIACSSKRHPSISTYRLGAQKDGTLVACSAEVILDAGAYATLSPAVSWRSTVHACGPYRIPHAAVDVYAVATNKVPTGAFRGFGTPQVIFAMERMMDMLAERLDIDPLEIRRRNIFRKGDTTVTGQNLTKSVGLKETLRCAANASEWKKKRRLYSSTRAQGDRRRGIGCATFFYGVGLGAAGRKIDVADAAVQVHPDGSVWFSVGTTDMGQGMETVLSQIVAESLGGISPQAIAMTPVDTSRVQNSGPTVASRATFMSGNALATACKQIMKRMKNAAATMLNTSPDSIKIKNGVFESDTNSVTFTDVSSHCSLHHISLATRELYESPETSWNPENGQGDAYVVYSYATHIAEVEIDVKTGEIRVLNFWAAHDVGTAVNPQQVEGQIEGGVLQGIGFALLEKLDVDNLGRVTNPDFSTYIIPTAVDIPAIYPIIIEHPYPQGPYGVKGFGETPLMGAGAAVANAIAHAIGHPVLRLPLMPEDIVAFHDR